MDKFIIIKLISSEEIVCTLVDENEHDVKTLFPMIVRSIPRMSPEGRIMESLVMAPYSHFAADDQFDFHKSQIIFIKELGEKYIDSYKLAVDDFVASTCLDEKPATVEDLKDALDKLAETFGDQIEYEDNVESDTDTIFINNTNKILH